MTRLHGIYVRESALAMCETCDVVDHYLEKFMHSYSAKCIASLFNALRRDYFLELNRRIGHLQQDINDFTSGKMHCHWVDDNAIEQCIPSCHARIERIRKARGPGHKIILDTEAEAFAELEKTIRWCKNSCDNPIAFYESGTLHFLRGDNIEAIEDGLEFINKSLEQNGPDLSNVQLQLGVAYSESLEYDKAIVSLTQAITLNPENKEAYFERAAAYFETGNFDQAFADFLSSNFKSTPLTNKSEALLGFAAGIDGGIPKGVAQGGLEFINLLASTYGIKDALWRFAQDPIKVTKDFADAALDCMSY
ncbi:MAG: tetratricopeptide repeat protein, partial [Chlamydiales bacterium]